MNLLNKDEKNYLSPEALLRCVQKSQSGDRAAFSQLVDYFKEWIFFHLYRWTGDREETQDLAQEVFLKAYASLKNFRSEAKFSTWLFQIALNLYRDYQKKQVLRESKKKELYQTDRLLETKSEVAEQRIYQRQLIEKLRRSLLTLAPHYREALQLRYLSELSYQDCAEILGEGLSSVKMRVARGLALLKKKLGNIHG